MIVLILWTVLFVSIVSVIFLVIRSWIIEIREERALRKSLSDSHTRYAELREKAIREGKMPPPRRPITEKY